MLTKINYPIQTQAIKETIIPRLEPGELNKILVYASEADLLNLVLFGMTAKQWRERNPDQTGNIRDYATVQELTVLSNLQVLMHNTSVKEPHRKLGMKLYVILQNSSSISYQKTTC